MGLTGNPHIPSATSLVDYIFRWLELRFVQPSAPKQLPEPVASRKAAAAKAPITRTEPVARATQETSTGIGCPDCGSVLVFAEGVPLPQLRLHALLRAHD